MIRLPPLVVMPPDQRFTITFYFSGDPMSHLETYVKDACRTESMPALSAAEYDDSYEGMHCIHGTQAVRLLHSSVGMASEIGEYLQARYLDDDINVLEELGDMMWYWAIAVDALSLNPFGLSKQGEMMAAPLSQATHVTAADVERELFSAIGDWNDAAKKHAFYGKPLDLSEVGALLAIIYRSISDLHELRAVHSLEETLRRNIAKLRVRYPKKYSDEEALDRDLAAERKVLEGE